MSKRKITWFVICVAITASSAVCASGGAAAMERCEGGGHRFCPPGPMVMEPPPLEKMFGIMTPTLKLSDEQQRKIKLLLKNHHEQMVQLRKKHMDAREQVRAALSTSSVDEKQVREKAADSARLDVEFAVSQARFHNQINALLTLEQRERWAQISNPHHPGEHLVPPKKSEVNHCPCHIPPPPCGREDDNPERGMEE